MKIKLISLLIILCLPLMAFDLTGGCLSCDSATAPLGLTNVPGDTLATGSNIIFDPNVVLDLPNNVNQVIPSDVSFYGTLPTSLLPTNTEVNGPTVSNPAGSLKLASTFNPFDQSQMKNNIGDKANKLMIKMTDSINGFIEDIVNRLRAKFPMLVNNEGKLVGMDVPYIENNLDLRTLVKLERPGDGTYEITLGIGNISVANYSLDLTLFFMKWQPNSSCQFKGYVIVNTKLINYVLQAVYQFKLPFDYVRVDFDFQLVSPSVEIWLHGISNLPDSIPAFLKFQYARIGMDKVDNGFRIRTTFEGLAQPSCMDIISKVGISMTNPKLKFVAYAQIGGQSALAIKFENYGLAGKLPIVNTDVLLTVSAGAKLFFDSGVNKLGIELELANPKVKFGTWESSFGDFLTWITNQLLGVNNSLSPNINSIMSQRITEVNFYSSAKPDSSSFWLPMVP